MHVTLSVHVQDIAVDYFEIDLIMQQVPFQRFASFSLAVHVVFSKLHYKHVEKPLVSWSTRWKIVSAALGCYFFSFHLGNIAHSPEGKDECPHSKNHHNDLCSFGKFHICMMSLSIEKVVSAGMKFVERHGYNQQIVYSSYSSQQQTTGNGNDNVECVNESQIGTPGK